MATDSVVSSLARSTVFAGVDRERLEAIRGRGRMRSLEPSQIVVEEGQPSSALFVVVDGELEVFLPKTSDRYTRVRIATIAAGDCIGEYSLIDEKPASASVVATRRTDLFAIGRHDFLDLLEADPTIGRIVYRNLLLLLVARLREGNRQLDLFRPIASQTDGSRR
jgi:CRP/FNR family transcriptional regulator, cyclic AMP receptor protein